MQNKDNPSTNSGQADSPKAYQEFLHEVVHLVQHHRVIAIKTVQTVSNQLYWEMGELIIKRQQEYGWGNAIIERLSSDMAHQIGETVSWSPRNLRLMKQIVEEYSNVKQPVSHLKKDDKSKAKKDLSGDNKPVSQFGSYAEKMKSLVLAVPWGQNILILQKVKDPEARLFYLQTTIKNQYSRAVLLHQIKADAYGHYLLNKSQNNFETALPEHLWEQAQESIKSVYMLDFLDINKPMTERQLEASMVGKVKRLLMELGYGFCFIGNQYRISLGEKDYYIDLLFYHRILKCLVAVELKVIDFEPEFVGKLDFYLQLIDNQLKQPEDEPSIGILLVPTKDHLEVEYALRTTNKPIGVAEYKLSKELPAELLGKLPTQKDFDKISNELNKKANYTDLDENPLDIVSEEGNQDLQGDRAVENYKKEVVMRLFRKGVGLEGIAELLGLDLGEVLAFFE